MPNYIPGLPRPAPVLIRCPPCAELMYHCRSYSQDKDRIAGAAKEIKGSVKETIGKAVGDAKLQSDGKTDKVEGKVQNLSAVSRTR